MSDEQPPPTGPTSTDDSERRLTPREAAVAEELGRIDPHLAGMFRIGVMLQARVHEPGVKFVVGNITREITLGVVRKMAADSGIALKDEELERLREEKESNRASIAQMLQLPTDHPVVDDWFRFQKSLPGLGHYSFPGPNPQEAADAFDRLKRYLFGQLGLYYETRAELDELLTIEAPGTSEITRLRQLLSRPAQRAHFFRQLAHPQWLPLLLDAGFLPNAPSAIRTEAGLQPRPWAEGEFLKRVAAQVPDLVATAVNKIPTSLENPLVWHTVAELAGLMPQPFASQVGRRLLRVARHPSPGRFFIYEPLIDLSAKAAGDGDPRLALNLTHAMLQISRAVVIDVDEDTTWKPLRWLFRRIRSLDYQRLCERALPAIEQRDPIGLLRLLLHQLERAVDVARREGRNEPSRYWCEHLDSSADPREDDVRALLAVAAARAAFRLAGTGPGAARDVLSAMEPYADLEIVERLRIGVLSRSGQHLPRELNQLIGSQIAVDPPFGAAEIAALLREQFSNASAEAQQTFFRAVEQGPPRDQVDALVESSGSPRVADQITAEWQATRLRWFHDRLPEELRGLAQRLGVEPRKPSVKQQALDEIGHYMDFSSGWIHPMSPKTPAELAALPPSELAHFLAAWVPPPDTITLDVRGFEGLQEALTDYASHQPHAAIETVRILARQDPRPRYVSSLLAGIRKAFASDPRGAVLVASDMLAAAETAVIGQQPVTAAVQQEWRWVAVEAVDLLTAVCRSNLLPIGAVGDVWRLATVATVSAFAWAFPDPDHREYRDFDDVLTDALNHFAGRATAAVVEAALWHYRTIAGAADRDPSAEAAEKREMAAESVRPHLLPLLEFLLQQENRAGITAQAEIGQYLPQVHLLARRWLLDHQVELFRDGAREPLRRPAWGAYVTRARLYWSVFRDLRTWYREAAEVADIGPADKGRFSITQHLAVHVTYAFLSGQVSLGDSDRLLEVTFERVPVRDRAHVYWELSRGFSEDSRSEPAKRLAVFWKCRLDILESAEADEEDVAKELQGLTALIAVSAIQPADAIALGERTVRLAGGHVSSETAVWERLAELAKSNIQMTYRIAETVIHGSLSERWPLLTFDIVAPVLRQVLRSTDQDLIRESRRLINELGERGYTEFGCLLGE